MLNGASLLQVLKGQVRSRPLRLLLILAQIALAALVVTVALHALEADRARIAQQGLFAVSAQQIQGQHIYMAAPFTAASTNGLLALAPDVENIARYSSLPGRPRVEADGQLFMLSTAAEVDAAYLTLRGASMTSGALVGADAPSLAQNEILLEDEVARAMFMGGDPLGRSVSLVSSSSSTGPNVFRIAGTYRYTDSLTPSTFGPLSRPVALIALRPGSATDILVMPRPGRAEAAQGQIVSATRQLFAGFVAQNQGVDFYIGEPERPANYFDRVDPHILLFSLFGITALVLVGVAVFSLTVVDVSEQTHQIGVRRVLGASRWRIAGEYAATASLYALVAGVVGGLTALLLVPVLHEYVGGALLPGAVLEVRPLLAVATVLVLFFLSAGLGLVPALSAGLERPAVALRER